MAQSWRQDSQIAVKKKKNCVEKLREMVPPNGWFFVPTGLNPADVGTRPVSLKNIELDFWLKGPQFLLSDRKDWHSQTFFAVRKGDKIGRTSSRGVDFQCGS